MPKTTAVLSVACFVVACGGRTVGTVVEGDPASSNVTGPTTTGGDTTGGNTTGGDTTGGDTASGPSTSVGTYAVTGSGPVTAGPGSGAGGASSGAGGAPGTGGMPGTGGGTMCTPSFSAMEDPVDDIADGDPFLPSIGGRAGSWHASHDDTPNATMFPPGFLFQMSANRDPCRRWYARTYGGPFTIWGASIGFGLGAPYDASNFSGFSFWAQSSAGGLVIRVQFPDDDTDPRGGLCDPTTNGPNFCYDHWNFPIRLASTPTKYIVPFTALRQLGWGRLSKAFDPKTVYGVEFAIPAGANFDFWVDDVAFIRR